MIPSMIKRLSSSLSFGRNDLTRSGSKREDGVPQNKKNKNSETDSQEISVLRRQPTHELANEETGNNTRKSSRSHAVESVRQATMQLSTRTSLRMSISQTTRTASTGSTKQISSKQSSTVSISRVLPTKQSNAMPVSNAKTASLSKKLSTISNGHKVVRGTSVARNRKSLSTGSVRKILSESSRHDSSNKSTVNKLKKRGGKQLWFPRGALLAVKADDNCEFYLCRSLRSVYNYTKEVPVRWLIKIKKSKFNEYRIGYKDSVETYSILLQVNLIKVSRTRYTLPDNELAEIQKLLRLSEDVEKGDLTLDKLTDDVAPVILIDEPPVKKPRLIKTTSQKLRDKAARILQKREQSENGKSVKAKSVKGGEKGKRTAKPKGDGEPKKRKLTKKEREIELHPRPDIQILEKDPLFETRTPMPYISKIANSRLIFRAINLEDNKLLTKLLQDGNNIYKLYKKSVDSDNEPLWEAFKSKNKDIILTVLHEFFGEKFAARLLNNVEEQRMLEKLNTGSYNQASLGVQFIRKISASRGCREGNNAFLKDDQRVDYDTSSALPNLLKSSLRIDKEQLDILEKFCEEAKMTIYNDHQLFCELPNLLLLGRNEIAGKVAQSFLTGYRSAINSLYVDVLLFTNEDLKHCSPSLVKHTAKRLKKLSPIHCAATNPNSKYLEKLLSVQHDVHICDTQGRAPIHYSAGCSSTSTLKLLLHMGANTQQADSSGKTPLIYAIEANRPENVILLLEDYKKRESEGAVLAGCVNRRIKDSRTPLHISVEKKLFDVTKILLDYGADVNAKLSVNNNQETPFMKAAASGDLKIVRLLMEYNPVVEQRDRMGRTAVIHACMNGATSVLSYLLNIGANGERADNSGNTPLHYAAAYGWFFTVKLLLDSGVDSNAFNMWKITPVAIAYLKQYVGIVRELLNNGKADINFPDDNGRTMIFHACSQDNGQSDLYEQIRYIVEEKGAICSLKDDKDQTPLHDLALLTARHVATPEGKEKHFQQCVAIAELLLKNGCELNAVNKTGYTAVMNAMQTAANFPMVEFLIKAGCKILPHSDAGNSKTLLHAMTENLCNNPENLCKIIHLLKEQKCLDHIKSMAKCVNGLGLTPLHTAITYQQAYGLKEDKYPLVQKYIRCIIHDLEADVNAKEQFISDLEHKPYGYDIATVGKAAIHFAMSKDDAVLVEQLIKFGADVNMYDGSGLTPLALCIKNSFMDVLDLLFKTSKCDFNLPVQTKWNNAVYKVNPLIYAATSFTAAHWSFFSNGVSGGKGANIINKLIDYGCDINSVSPDSQMTCLHLMTSALSSTQRQDILKVVEKLETRKYDFNLVDSHKKTALHYAVRGNTGSLDESHELEVKLIQLGTKVGLVDDEGKTALHYVFDKNGGLRSDPAELTKLICRSLTKDQWNIRDVYGRTALHYAAMNGAVTCCMYLSMIGADVNIKDNVGNTALALAVLCSKDGCATTLIQSGTNLKYLVSKDKFQLVAPVNTNIADDDLSEQDSSDSEESDITTTVAKLHTEVVPKEIWKWHVATLLKKEEVINNIPLYQAIIENNLTGAAMFVVDAGYKKSGLTEFDAIRMALVCCRYNIALRLLCTTTDMNLFRQLGDHKRNLLHILGLSFEHNTNTKNDALIKIAEILIKVGVSPTAFDTWNCTPLMYAVINRHYAVANFMADKVGGFDLNYEDGFQKTYLAAALWKCHSSKICADTLIFIKSLPKVNLNSSIYLPLNPELASIDLAGKKSDPDIWQSYPDDKTTALIIAIDIGDFTASNNLLLHGADPNTPDGNGITPLMHAIIQNNVNHVKQLMDHSYDPVKEAQLKSATVKRNQIIWSKTVQPFVIQLKDGTNADSNQNTSVNEADKNVSRDKSGNIDEEFTPIRKTSSLNLNAKDSNGRTALHYVAKLSEAGTFDNAEIAFLLVKAGAGLTEDSSGHDPYDLALESGATKVAQVLKKHFRLTRRKEKSHRKPDFVVDDRTSLSLMDLPDYKSVAENFMKSFDTDMEDGDTYVHKVDELCNIINGQLVLDQEQSVLYDALMTKVDVSRGEWGLYNFYQMQLVHQPSKSLYVMFTRWGRIQDKGQYQHTPFTDKDEAVIQFKKLFREKTGNTWTDIKNFQRKPGKYRLVEDIARKAPPSQKDVVFNFKSRCKSVLPKHLYRIIASLMDPKAMQISMSKTVELNSESLPFGQLNRERLLMGKQLLDQLEILVDETEKYTSSDNIANKEHEEIVAYQNKLEKIEELSNEFFHVIPQANFVYEMIRPLYKRKALDAQIYSLKNLLDYEIACKMLLAAMHEKQKYNPVDYVYRCLDCKMEQLNENDTISQMILKYIWKGGNQYNFKVHSIYKIARKGESERLLATGIENRRLLWHGSGKTNMLSILSRGLLVAPPEARTTGWAYGKGIYFSDTFSISNGYAGSSTTKVMLLCEVALGNMHIFNYHTHVDKPSTCDSVMITVNKDNDHSSWFILRSGASIAHDLKRNYNAYSQYVITDPAQVCLRYLVYYS